MEKIKELEKEISVLKAKIEHLEKGSLSDLIQKEYGVSVEKAKKYEVRYVDYTKASNGSLSIFSFMTFQPETRIVTEKNE